MGTAGVHRAATAFAGAASVYEQTRPDYPPEALSWLAERLDLRPRGRVLDLAAGTGKLTRGLMGLGATVIAVEPVEGMRRKLAHVVPGAQIVAGVAQAIPLGTETVDAVTVAQAMHWFATERALQEMHRVLRPGSRLAVVWNRRELSDPLQATLQRLMAPLRGDTPSGATGEWRRVLHDAGRATPRFVPEAQLRAPWSHPIDVDGVAGRVASVSFVAGMDPAERERLLEEVRTEARRYPPPLSLRYTTEIFCYRRAG
ncbi:MAG TPA: methyltransferase domain-containing protein [Acidimicrobiales bacterium]